MMANQCFPFHNFLPYSWDALIAYTPVFLIKNKEFAGPPDRYVGENKNDVANIFR